MKNTTLFGIGIFGLFIAYALVHSEFFAALAGGILAIFTTPR